MPQYRFRGQDKDGKVRAGRITAASKAEAHQRIELTGLKIVELTEIIESGASSVQVQGGGKSSTTFRATRAEPYEVRDGWLSRLFSKLPSGQVAFGFFAVVAVIGLIVTALTWNSGASTSKAARESPKIPISVNAKGAIRVPGVQDFGDVRVTLDFPEVPYQVSKRWSELEHPSAGRFIWKVDFICSVSPHVCIVRASKPDHEDAKSQPMAVKENKCNADVTLELKKEEAKPKGTTH